MKHFLANLVWQWQHDLAFQVSTNFLELLLTDFWHLQWPWELLFDWIWGNFEIFWKPLFTFSLHKMFVLILLTLCKSAKIQMTCCQLEFNYVAKRRQNSNLTRYRLGQPKWNFWLWIFHRPQCGNLVIFMPLWFYVKSILADFRKLKTGVLTILVALKSDFWKNFTLEIQYSELLKRSKWQFLWKTDFTWN